MLEITSFTKAELTDAIAQGSIAVWKAGNVRTLKQQALIEFARVDDAEHVRKVAAMGGVENIYRVRVLAQSANTDASTWIFDIQPAKPVAVLQAEAEKAAREARRIALKSQQATQKPAVTKTARGYVSKAEERRADWLRSPEGKAEAMDAMFKARTTPVKRGKS